MDTLICICTCKCILLDKKKKKKQDFTRNTLTNYDIRNANITTGQNDQSTAVAKIRQHGDMGSHLHRWSARLSSTATARQTIQRCRWWADGHSGAACVDNVAHSPHHNGCCSCIQACHSTHSMTSEPGVRAQLLDLLVSKLVVAHHPQLFTEFSCLVVTWCIG